MPWPIGRVLPSIVSTAYYSKRGAGWQRSRREGEGFSVLDLTKMGKTTEGTEDTEGAQRIKRNFRELAGEIGELKSPGPWGVANLKAQ